MLTKENPRAYDETCPLCRFMGGPCVFHAVLAWDALHRDVMAAGEEERPLAERKPITETPQ